MAMAVGETSDDDVISTINTTPLVDVMLVLLIIFLITIPVVTTSIPVSLPKERVEVREVAAQRRARGVERDDLAQHSERALQLPAELAVAAEQQQPHRAP